MEKSDKTKAKKGTGRRSKLTVEGFIRLWQKARNIQEVVHKAGISAGGVYARVNKYRRYGIDLRPMSVIRPHNSIRALAAIAETLTEK